MVLNPWFYREQRYETGATVMGISTNIYGYFGIKIDWDDALSDAYDNVYDDHDTPDCQLDGMSGDYMVFGERLYNSGDFRWGMEDGDGCKRIELDKLPQIEAEYKAKFVKKFPDFAHLMDRPFEIIIFTHYH
jgi:hypothetical protein